ncbi:carbamoyltransferase HypF [Shewanella sp. GutDb-MelDb]|uniref:carbamoyltransferase HypF n=1 Tax=Shewanella sp. GutDb-MelDb TaxID=2058316 RepID=UPI000C7E70A0|nr:carbamoyltransferase HypF [Shewanella sp. GutDb-MelDb]PKG59021.1 carbamoyltransferase HypF [Shewanella sp. GutDb-MelDb]
MTQSIKRVLIKITGIVQGVGFRPFVYRLAHELKLTGSVLNNSEGVTIEAQASEDVIDQFKTLLIQSPPPLARIDNISMTVLPPVEVTEPFCIIHSKHTTNAVVAVSPDKCSCDDCIADITNPQSRYFRYPFTNCTNCGPRYSIINTLPYDRKNTSMAHFDMCSACESEYQNPLNRRYHAQPVSCPDCGPLLTFKKPDLSHHNGHKDALEQTVAALKAGNIVAIKGLGGFHLVCDASNQHSLEALRARKHRPAKPLAIMVKDIWVAKQLVEGNETEWLTLASNERPIVVMRKKLQPTLTISKLVAPDIDRLGVFLPYTPLHHLLLQQVDLPLVMTSANLSGEPIITDSADIAFKLGHVVDYILDHNRPILNGCDDSVVQVINHRLQVIRLARGYAPLSIYSPKRITSPTLGLGAQQKNTVCFGFEHNVFLSPHIGDLVSIEAESYFHDTLETFSRLYRFKAERLVHDLHPDYFTSRWGESLTGIKRTAVQHHYAHVLSVLAENKSTQQVLAFAFDGTGLGTDNTLWGGEALIADAHCYHRIAYLKPFKLIGGEQAIKQPVRLLLSILLEKYSLQQINHFAIPAIGKLSTITLSNLNKVWQTTPAAKSTSSIGRLFDVVAVLLNLIDKTQYEGQAGILLETAANQAVCIQSIKSIDITHAASLASNKAVDSDSESIIFDMTLSTDNQWDSTALIKQILDAVISQPLTPARTALIAKAFMDTLAKAICDVAKHYPQYPIVLTGGVFQNRYLSEHCEKSLQIQGNKLIPSGRVPINDAGIALGQAWYAIHNTL